MADTVTFVMMGNVFKLKKKNGKRLHQQKNRYTLYIKVGFFFLQFLHHYYNVTYKIICVHEKITNTYTQNKCSINNTKYILHAEKREEKISHTHTHKKKK